MTTGSIGEGQFWTRCKTPVCETSLGRWSCGSCNRIQHLEATLCWMKPKRRATFSPASAETTLKSPRLKRRRLGTPSPTRRKSSNSSEEVKPPPEFIPFAYDKQCPKLRELVEKNTEDITLDRDDLLCLQHELEKMLAHSADYLRRAHGEVMYLNTGDYPVQDLRTRPMPSYKLREFVPVSPTTTQELQNTLCGLPEDDTEDNVDIWPPHHIPQRFWTWCKADFLTPVDAEYLRSFKSLLLDKYSPEDMKYYYVNEPWKYRKRQSCRSRISSHELLSSRTARRLSSDVHSAEKRWKEKEEKSQSCNRKVSGSCARSTRGSDSKLAPLISDVVCAASREMRKDDFTTPSRRSSTRLHSRDDYEDDRKILVKSELYDAAGYDFSIGEPHSAPHVNGFSSRSPLSSRMHSPRVKKESKEEDEDWDRPGPSNSFTTSNLTNGRCNGEVRTRPRRNGEAKRENGVQPNVSCNLSLPVSPGMSSVPEEVEIERHYREIGSRIVRMLVERGLIPSSTEYVYREIATNSVQREISISHEGKEEDDDSDLDEVSEELLRCQMELQELEPRLRGVISHCWSKVKGEFAYWETSKQLDDADIDLFRLGINMYRDLPTRRIPTNTELPTLRTALRRRNRKARQHYGCFYKRLRKYRKCSRVDIQSYFELYPTRGCENRGRMDYRVRIAFLTVAFLCSVQGFHPVVEIPPPLQERASTVTKIVSSLKRSATSIEKPPILPSNGTTMAAGTASVVQSSHSPQPTSSERTSVPVNIPATNASVHHTQNVSSPSVAAPEFEDRNEQDEGGKGEEDPDAHVDEAANAAPPADDEAAGEGVAKEDTEPVKGRDKEENQLGAMVEDAKGNIAAPLLNKFQTHVDFDQSEDSHFMTFVMVAGLLVFCLYLLNHNKKKILGLVFEGRAPGHHRRNVRYRRLSQRDEHDKEDVIY
ncbi:hypothetical protein GCK32_001175 [Trichostrongylus colubriformis]|uniref:Uncharacterized protein n=1 Tax=Trichostrongylus colubriformis TaxID=6319 RepID=A0AAN8IHV2_TRICO